MQDTIGRQAAIDVIDKEQKEIDVSDVSAIYAYSKCKAIIKQLPSVLGTEAISRQAAIDYFVTNVGFRDEDGYPIEDECELREIWTGYFDGIPSAQPERRCVNCGRTVNNGGWYEDGRTRCPIEEHYALPKDGFCHLWEKRNITDDDYPERRTDE